MGRPPAYIFVVRHGKRLDAADKQWHLSSPTPYDPPLTYGGWLQSKAVGAQIASILREREAYDATHLKKRRRYRVVLHSSPFLRCVQTCIAISAGLASNPPPLSSPSSEPGPPPTHADAPPTSPEESRYIEKSVLRLDAFLGEWLSPDYFEHITPPPNSTLMLATAKAELLRREDYYDYPHPHDRIPPANSTQLWSASHTRDDLLAPSAPVPSLGLDSVASLVGTLPDLNGSPHGDSDQKALHGGSSDPVWARTYVAPVPTYALSSSEPIPKGYVAHARDACVQVDYHWDSTRDNLAWGTGGELPEEWAAMHQRFRRGLKRLVNWYTTTDNPREMVTKAPTSPNCIAHCRDSRQYFDQGRHAQEEEHDEVETEEVVVLVSHGAGCNALIGAITHQPVLADVAMSSLTMAKRRPQFGGHAQPSANERAAPSLDDILPRSQTSIPDIFELKLFANVDHLHSAVNSPAVSRSSSLAHAHEPPRGRLSSGLTSALKDINFGSYLHGGPAGGSRSNSASASLGSMRRSSGGPSLTFRQSIFNNHNSSAGSTAGNHTSQLPPTRESRSESIGLWTPIHEDSDSEVASQLSMLHSSHENSHEKEETPTKDITKDITEKGSEVEHPGAGIISGPISPRGVHEESATSEVLHEEEHDTFDEAIAPRLWAGTGTGNGGYGELLGLPARPKDYVTLVLQNGDGQLTSGKISPSPVPGTRLAGTSLPPIISAIASSQPSPNFSWIIRAYQKSSHQLVSRRVSLRS